MTEPFVPRPRAGANAAELRKLQTADTKPVVHRPGYVPEPEAEPEVLTAEQALRQQLQLEHPAAPEWGIAVLANQKVQGDDIADLKQWRKEQEAAAKPHRPKALSLTGMTEEEVAASFRQAPVEEQNAAVAKGLVRNHKQTRNQTLGGITALIVAVGGILGTVSHMFDTYQKRQDAHAVELAAQAAQAAQRAAREGAVEGVRDTPPQIVPVPVLAPAAVPSGVPKR